MNIIFKKPSKEGVKELDYPKGIFTTSEGADIEYYFYGSSSEVTFSTRGWFFSERGVNDLIEFLKAVKTELESVK